MVAWAVGADELFGWECVPVMHVLVTVIPAMYVESGTRLAWVRIESTSRYDNESSTSM